MSEAAPVVIGKSVKAAFSSLTEFTVEFADDSGLILQTDTSNNGKLTGKVVQAEALPRHADAVCKVDWSWIIGSKVLNCDLNETSARLLLDRAGPLTISVQVWQGKPFLAFQPFRAPVS